MDNIITKIYQTKPELPNLEVRWDGNDFLFIVLSEPPYIIDHTNINHSNKRVRFSRKINKKRVSFSRSYNQFHKDFFETIGSELISPYTIKKKSRIEKYKMTFEKWIKENHHKIKRLSYNSIKKYLDENNLTELSSIWTSLQGNLNQKGLIEWFDEINLTFWVQDNKKDISKILKDLLIVAKKFYKTNQFTPNWSELEENGFNETNYLIRDGWNLDWRIEDLNNFYIKNGLPIIPTKSEKFLNEVLNMDIDTILDEILETFGSIPTLRNLVQSGLFYDFECLVRKLHSKDNKTENEFYESLWKNKYGPDYVKLTKKLISLDGHRCDSKQELILLNYRYLNNLPNNPHIPYNEIFPNEETNLICDNYTENKLVTEIAGYSPNDKRHEDYWRKIKSKQDICETYNVPFVLIEGYKFINTKNEDFLDYLHEIFSGLYDGMKKPSHFDVIKSQNTKIFITKIVEFFRDTNHITLDIIKNELDKKTFRFFCNEIKSIKNFISLYHNGVFEKFDTTKGIVIDFDSKTMKYIGLTEDEKIEVGMNLLVRMMKELNLTVLPESKFIESQKEYRKINDMFRNNSQWANIKQKKDGYHKLCKMLGKTVTIETKTDNFYENIQNLKDDLQYMSKIGNGYWIGLRNPIIKKEFRIKRIHNFINRMGGVVKFRTEYKTILDEFNFVYKGKNTKLV